MIVDPGLTAAANLTGGTVQCVQLVDGRVRKLRLRLRKNDIAVEMDLSPAAATDFAVELQEVLDWLGA